MPVEVFVDESERSQYLLVGVTIDSRDLSSTRQAMRKMRLPGERRIHLTTEKIGRKKELLDRIAALPVRADVFVCPASEKVARPLLLRALVESAGSSLHRLVIESRDFADTFDQRLLIAMRLAGDFPPQATFEHLRPSEEPLLWIADGVAWGFGAGGDWRRRISPLVHEVAVIDP